jgi:outer membrane protein TolC
MASAEKPLSKSARLEDLDPRFSHEPLTLKDAMAIALAYNPSLALAGQNLLFAHGRLGETKSAFLPAITATPGENYVKRIATEGYGIQATLPIDISHLLSAASQQAEFQEIAARLDVNRVRNEVIFGVQRAFYSALRSEALVKVADENLHDSLDRLNDAQARYKAQAVAYIDVVRAQTDVAASQKQVIQAQSAVVDGLATLARTIGVDVTSKFEVGDQGAVDEPPASVGGSDDIKNLATGPQFKGALDEALKTRPEILEADASIAAAKQGVLIARRSELPSLQLGVGYFDFRNQTGTLINEPQAFVGFSVPIFDGQLAKARGEEARASVSEAVTTRRQQVDNVSLDVQHAYLAVIQARDQVAVANQGVVQAKAAFDLARVRYNAGVASHSGLSPLLEVSDAQAALTLAEQNQVNALYDYNDARALLDRSVGRFAFTPTGPGFHAIPDEKLVGR